VGILGIVLPELSAHLEDEAEGAPALWQRLHAVDAMQAAGTLPGDAVLLAVLLYGPLHEAVVGAPDPARAFDEFFEGMVERLAVPRRMRDRMRLVFAAQRRLDRGRIAPLQRREFYRDAVALFRVRCKADGTSLPDWLLAESRERPPRPRRRPR
jgi:hypothetical protein